MRKLGIAILVIIAVLVVAVLVFAATFNVNKYRGTIEAELQKRIGRNVQLGQMSLKIFPPRFSVNNLVVSDDPRFSADTPFIKAQQVDLSVKFLPLLHKQIEINSFDLQRPTVNLIKNQSGTWNFASLGHPSESQPAPTEKPESQAKKPETQPRQPAPVPSAQPQSSPSTTAQQFSLSQLTIRDGQVSVLDEQKSKTPSLYDHIDITLKDFAPNQPFTIDASVHTAGTGAEQIRLQGKGGPIVESQPATTPFQGTLDIKQVGIADLAKFLNSPALVGTDGIITGQTKIDSKSGKLTAQGKTEVQNAKVRGMELGYPIVAQYDISDDLTSDLIGMRQVVLTLGQTPFHISGNVNAKPTPMQLDVNVKADNVSIAEIAKLAASSGVALSQGTNVTGNVNLNVQARGPADKPALNGTLTASNVDMSGKEIAQPVRIPSINLHLTPAQVQSDPFTIVSGGTTLNGQLAVHNYTSPTPTMDARINAANAQLPAILAIAKAYAVKGIDKVNGSGVLNMDMRASGPVKSLSEAEIMKALNGTMNLNFNNVVYSGADVLHELGPIAGLLNLNQNNQTTQGITKVLKMTGDIAVKNGIAQTNNLQAQLEVGTLALAGAANLADQTLNMRATAVLSQAFSQKAGGTSVGGYLNTAMANNQGQLVIPALVTGTFSNPKFSPDVQQVAQMKLKGLVPNMDNPSSLVGTLGKFLGNQKGGAEGQQQNQQQQEQKPSAAQQILGILGKNKTQSTPTPQPSPK